MTNALLECTTCNDIFRSRYDMNNHVRREHQLSVKVKFQGGSATEVKRGADGMFKCECGKSFKLPSSVLTVLAPETTCQERLWASISGINSWRKNHHDVHGTCERDALGTPSMKTVQGRMKCIER